MSTIYITFAARTVLIARPATYPDLLREIRRHYPSVSAVYNLTVLFQPMSITGVPLENWVQVDPSAYSAIHNGAELFVNVVHPLTREYILPMPGGAPPNHHDRKQARRTDGDGNRVGDEPGDFDATGGDDQVSKSRPRGVSSRSRGASQKDFGSSLSLELERAGGDAFGNGWGGASERFWRSTKLVPNLKDCKEAIGQSVGESNFYPEDEEEQLADINLGSQQNQDETQHGGAEPAQVDANLGDANQGDTEARHLAGGQEGENEGKRNTIFHSDEANRNWFAVPHSPSDPFVSPPRSRRGRPLHASPQWGLTGRVGHTWGGFKTPSPQGWVPYHRGRNNVPAYVRSRSCSPVGAGVGNWGANPGGWISQLNGTHFTDQEFSRIDAGQGGQTEAGHLTNGANTNGVLTNGDLTNGYPTAHSEVSHNSQHQVGYHGASEWSPVRRQFNGYQQPQYPRIQGYHHGQLNTKVIGGRYPRRDPAEVTYGSPRPRVQGSTSGLTTIGRKKKTWTWTDNPVQEESDHDGAPGPSAANNQAWYASPPPQPNFNRTAGHGGGAKHRCSNKYQQKQASGPAVSWGADFWGGPPPNRNQRGALAQDDTPASKHWQ